VAAAVQSFGLAADSEDEDEHVEGLAPAAGHGRPAITAAAAGRGGAGGAAAASTARPVHQPPLGRLSEENEDEEDGGDEEDAGRTRHHVTNALLMGLDEHDDERGRLARALHAATNRVKETYAALKVRKPTTSC
jgi:hypothetical protein